MKTFSALKDQALEALEGDWWIAAGITLVCILISQSPTVPTLFSESYLEGSFNVSYADFFFILLLPLGYGYGLSFLTLLRGKSLRFDTLLEGFKDYGRVLGTLLIEYIYILLWSLLFVIPGIIKCYSYSMTIFLMIDNPKLSYNAAIEESMKMMQGNKMRLFLLDLSLIGWLILSFMTLGIGLLFLSPYYMTIHAAFYEDLKREKYGSIEIIAD